MADQDSQVQPGTAWYSLGLEIIRLESEEASQGYKLHQRAWEHLRQVLQSKSESEIFLQKTVNWKKIVRKDSYSYPQIEKDYAASLRKLVKNFSPKKNDKEQETTQKTEFRYKNSIL